MKKLREFLWRMKGYFDFEGRCTICKKRLPLKVTVANPHKVIIYLMPCVKHEEESIILIPQRSDILSPIYYVNGKKEPVKK